MMVLDSILHVAMMIRIYIVSMIQMIQMQLMDSVLLVLTLHLHVPTDHVQHPTPCAAPIIAAEPAAKELAAKVTALMIQV